MSGSLLLIEDDVSISEMVRDYLSNEGYKVITAKDAVEAAIRFDEMTYELVLLDLMLPKGNGLDLLQHFRKRSRVPILILSAKDGEVDKALGLRFGADDYIAKPFSLMELSARVQAAIRRATQYAVIPEQLQAELLNVGELCIDPSNFTVTKRGELLKLTAKEFHILKLFVQHPTRVYTKAQIYSLLWNEEYYGDENVINVHMRRLREKIEDDPSNPIYIRTLWGIGYKLGEM
ncbi:response regulator transcription factor [Paenibacillus sp. NRS-1760]|uniref:response regulator transcription factor n=1 Tax=Paenibacillus sp. NRS-1760 TaxID=3233902 RepID=UPI003D2A2B2C